MRLSIEITNAASHLQVVCSWGPRFVVTPMLTHSYRLYAPLGKMSILTDCCGFAHVRIDRDMPGLKCGNCGRGQVDRATVFPVGSESYDSWIEDQFEPLLAEVVASGMVAALRGPYEAVLAGPAAVFQKTWVLYDPKLPSDL